MSSMMRIENVTTMGAVQSGMPVGASPGSVAAEPVPPTTTEPGPSETQALANVLGGNAVEAVMMLELRDFQTQRQNERKQQVARREEHMAEARSAYRHRIREAEETRRAALEGAVLTVACTAASTQFESGPDAGAFDQGASKVLETAPGLFEKLDAAVGHGAASAREGLAAQAADYRGEYAAKLEDDAADRARSLAESQAKVLDLLQEVMRGQSESRSAATRA